MPNHITSRIELNGDKEQVKSLIEKFSTFHEKEIRKTHDGQIICQKKSGDFVGWYDEEKDEFQYSSDRGTDKRVKGLPDGLEYEYHQAFLHMPDFEKIVPTPEILKDTEFCLSIIEHAKNAVGVSVHSDGLIGALEKSNRVRDCFREVEKEDIPKVTKCIQAYYETGYFYWYDWNCANWGTKWNSYSCKKKADNIFYFDTAWSGVPDLICKTSEAFPDIEILYKYADEDSGSNVGDMTIKAGKITEDRSPENQSNRAYEIYLELNPDCDYIKMIDGKYQYVEENE